ncbi:MAG: hypothetical protein IPN22_10735 [Bacteroidetes bacterium]|nr:hypothetical protein [Bacteroidota bacterium]
MVRNIGASGLVHELFFLFNNELYFSANDGINGNDLWVSDGTTNG